MRFPTAKAGIPGRQSHPRTERMMMAQRRWTRGRRWRGGVVPITIIFVVVVVIVVVISGHARQQTLFEQGKAIAGGRRVSFFAYGWFTEIMKAVVFRIRPSVASPFHVVPVILVRLLMLVWMLMLMLVMQRSTGTGRSRAVAVQVLSRKTAVGRSRGMIVLGPLFRADAGRRRCVCFRLSLGLALGFLTHPDDDWFSLPSKLSKK